MKNGKTEWVLLGITAILAAACAVTFLTDDRQAPVINCSAETVTYIEGDPDAVLLEGMTAVDNVDGDVTENIKVDNLIPLHDGTQAKVYYAVSDRAGNVGVCSRIVAYQTSEKSTAGSTNNSSGSADRDKEVIPEASGSAGNTVRETTVAAENTAAAGREEFPVLILTTHEVRLSVGENFAYYNYVASVSDDKDDRDDLFRRINVQGNYDTAVPGEYELTFFVADSDGNRSAREKLTLIVE